MSTQPISDIVLAHYGVKGMKWGVRRDRTPTSVVVTPRPGKRVKTSGGKYQGPSEDAVRVATYKQTARKSSTDALSNRELQDLVNRMNLEQQYDRLDPTKGRPGRAFVQKFLKTGRGSIALDALEKTPAAAVPGVGPAIKIAKVANAMAGAGGGKKKK